jgi:hypothetical protein
MEPVTAYYVMYGRPKRGFGTEVAKNNAKRAGFVFFTSPGNKGRHNDCYFEYAYNNTGRCYLVHSDVRLEKPYNVEVSDVKRDTVIKLFATALSDRTKMTIIDLFAGCGGKEGEHKRSTWANHFTVRVFGQGLYGKMYYESGLALVIADKYKELALICSLFAEDGRYWTDKKINAVNDVAVYDSKLKKMLSEYLGIREWEARKLLRSYIGRIDKATIENINNRNDNPIELLRAMWRSYLRIEDGEDIGHRGLRGLREHRLNTMTRILMLGTEKLRESLQESRKIKEWCNLIYRSLVASCELLWYSWMWEQECVENDNWGILFRLRKLAQMYDWLGEGYGKKTFLGSYGIAVGERDYKAKKDRKKKKMEGMHQPLLNLVL